MNRLRPAAILHDDRRAVHRRDLPTRMRQNDLHRLGLQSTITVLRASREISPPTVTALRLDVWPARVKVVLEFVWMTCVLLVLRSS